MTTNAVSGTNPTANLSSVLSATRSFAKQADNDGDANSGGGVQGGGGTLFTALLSALTQFVTSHPAGTATAAPGTTGTTSTPAATTTTGTTTIPGTTTPATGGTSSTSGASSGAAPSSLPQDLQAFLHDLFGALRQEGHPRHEGGGSHHSHSSPEPVSTTPVPAPVSTTPVSGTPVPTPVTTTSTGTVTTPGVTPVTTPATTPPTTTTTGTATATGTGTTPVANPPGIAKYGQRGLIAELTALIKDLGNSGTTSDAANRPSRVSADTLADLNAAFAKLIGDLGGTTSVASPGTATVPPATDSSSTANTPAAGTASTPATTAASRPDTSALQSFLTSFLQDLQGSTASAAGTLGNGVNVTA